MMVLERHLGRPPGQSNASSPAYAAGTVISGLFADGAPVPMLRYAAPVLLARGCAPLVIALAAAAGVHLSCGVLMSLPHATAQLVVALVVILLVHRREQRARATCEVARALVAAKKAQ